jgi:group I intron endonuclease
VNPFIYLTTNLINGKQYVGSHNGDKYDSYLGSGKNIIKAIKKYGRKNFKREILESCNPENNLLLEEKYISKYNTLIPNGYNISPSGGHGLNGKISKISREKSSKKQKGISKKIYFIKKYGDVEGSKKYDEWLEAVKRGASKSGKMSKGRKLSEEAKINIGNSRRGKPILKLRGRKFSEEHRKKLSESHKGIKQSKETIEKRRIQQIGKKHSEETKQKMSLAAKGKPKYYDTWNKNKTTLNITP